jgi:hypothetical protein
MNTKSNIIEQSSRTGTNHPAFVLAVLRLRWRLYRARLVGRCAAAFMWQHPVIFLYLRTALQHAPCIVVGIFLAIMAASRLVPWQQDMVCAVCGIYAVSLTWELSRLELEALTLCFNPRS